ncbi:MAG TPA: Crp/Fnr family transcriptional regulator [Solirubrobacteraceae bacterium]|nr:Crp/Fnr family transcriptional regulator [Solirubrobacteraceae bacterium]
MSRNTFSFTEHAQVLLEDPDLAQAVPSARRSEAIRECTAEVLTLHPGEWPSAALPAAGTVTLVLEGLLLRRVGAGGCFGAELLGSGDLLQPWRGAHPADALATSTGWRVLEPTRLALLGPTFTRRLARYPQLTGALVGRALDRSRQLAINMAIVHQPRVDTRLHMLLWQLAGRWGRVRPDGVVVPLRLTHSLLAELVAARRPTVSRALALLAEGRRALPIEGGWLLCGVPPGELLALAPVAARAQPRGEEPAAPAGRTEHGDGARQAHRRPPLADRRPERPAANAYASGGERAVRSR